jgi:hypothetical protein
MSVCPVVRPRPFLSHTSLPSLSLLHAIHVTTEMTDAAVISDTFFLMRGYARLLVERATGLTQADVIQMLPSYP